MLPNGLLARRPDVPDRRRGLRLCACLALGLVLACGDEAPLPKDCGSDAEITSVPTPMWSYVPFNSQMYGSSQVSAEVWRDELLGWTFTSSGAWSSGEREAVAVELSAPSDLEVEEIHRWDDSCLRTTETYSVTFYVRHTIAFEGGLEIRGRSTAIWVGNFDGWVLEVLHSPPTEARTDPEVVVEGPNCPCDYSGSLTIFLGPSAIDPTRPRPVPIRGWMIVEDQAGEREFMLDRGTANLSPR